jgi:hypothetical protein
MDVDGPERTVNIGLAAAVLEPAAPVDVIAAPLAAPALVEGREFVTHGSSAGRGDIAQAHGVLGGPAGPGGQWFGTSKWRPDAGFAGSHVIQNDIAVYETEIRGTVQELSWENR